MSIPQQDSENFQYLNNSYSKHLNCGVCQKMFDRPLRLHPCAHSFCQKCVNHKHVIFCPTCDTYIELKQLDLTAANLITDLKVKCKNDGCPWKGQLEQYTKFHKNGCTLKSGGIQGWLQKINKSILATQSKIKNARSLEEQQIDKDDCVEIQEISNSRKKVKRQLEQDQKVKERQAEEIRAEKRRKLWNDLENKDQNKRNTARIEIKIPKCPKKMQSVVSPQCVEKNYKSNSFLDKTMKKNSPPSTSYNRNLEQKNKKSTIGEIIVPDLSRIASLTDKYLAPAQEKYELDEIYDWSISDQYQQSEINQKPNQKPIEISSQIFRPFDFLVNKHINKMEQKKKNQSKRLFRK